MNLLGLDSTKSVTFMGPPFSGSTQSKYFESWCFSDAAEEKKPQVLLSEATLERSFLLTPNWINGALTYCWTQKLHEFWG